MEFLKNENIVDVRVGALIMNMIDRKKNGWKISESKLGTRAVTKGEVHE